MSDLSNVLPSNKVVIEREYSWKNLFEKYENCNDGEDDGYELNDLIACSQVLDEEFEDVEEELEVDEDDDEVDFENNDESDDFKENNKELVAYNSNTNLIKKLEMVYEPKFINELKKAFNKRCSELEGLNLSFWKRSKTHEEFNESNLKTPNFEASTRSFYRTSEQVCQGGNNVPILRSPAFKMPNPINFNRDQFQFGGFPPGMDQTYNFETSQRLPFQFNELMNGSQKFNIRIREMHYDLSVDGRDITGLFLPNCNSTYKNMIPALGNASINNTVQNDNFLSMEPPQSAIQKDELNTSNCDSLSNSIIETIKDVNLSDSSHDEYGYKGKKTGKRKTHKKKPKKLHQKSKTKEQQCNTKKDFLSLEPISEKLELSYSDVVKLSPESNIKQKKVFIPEPELNKLSSNIDLNERKGTKTASKKQSPNIDLKESKSSKSTTESRKEIDQKKLVTKNDLKASSNPVPESKKQSPISDLKELKVTKTVPETKMEIDQQQLPSISSIKASKSSKSASESKKDVDKKKMTTKMDLKTASNPVPESKKQSPTNDLKEVKVTKTVPETKMEIDLQKLSSTKSSKSSKTRAEPKEETNKKKNKKGVQEKSSAVVAKTYNRIKFEDSSSSSKDDFEIETVPKTHKKVQEPKQQEPEEKNWKKKPKDEKSKELKQCEFSKSKEVTVPDNSQEKGSKTIEIKMEVSSKSKVTEKVPKSSSEAKKAAEAVKDNKQDKLKVQQKSKAVKCKKEPTKKTDEPELQYDENGCAFRNYNGFIVRYESKDSDSESSEDDTEFFRRVHAEIRRKKLSASKNN